MKLIDVMATWNRADENSPSHLIVRMTFEDDGKARFEQVVDYYPMIGQAPSEVATQFEDIAKVLRGKEKAPDEDVTAKWWVYYDDNEGYGLQPHDTPEEAAEFIEAQIAVTKSSNHCYVIVHGTKHEFALKDVVVQVTENRVVIEGAT